MRFLIINNDYAEFLRWLYAQHPGLEKEPYAAQMRVRYASLFGVADFYSSNLCKLGHEARDIHVNNEFIQKAWAQEHGLRFDDYEWRFRLRRGVVPWVSRVRSRKWFYEVLAAQIKHYQPDVLLNQAMDCVDTSFLQEIKRSVRLLIGLGEPPVLLNETDWAVYDLVLAPSEGMADHFRGVGIRAELLRFAFEARVLSTLNSGSPGSEKPTPVSFVGSIWGCHSGRRELLERLCARMGDAISVWAPSVGHLPADSSVRERYRGTAWGRDLYRVLATSKVTWNSHIDVAGQSADNMRLFEATGVGTLLITDWKVNLHKIFEPGKEVIAYRNADECVELARYYLAHDDEREAIARAGQERTLREHTYYHRMQELLDIVQRYI